MNTENRSLNIIVAGKSGVGKSSFLNYLVGSEVFKTGVGEPVTQNYFDHTRFHPETNVYYNLYDTKGVEPQTTGEFKTEVIGMVTDRGKSENVFEWIHSLYYCVAASSKRIESFETEFIRNISQYVHVVVLLTKSDLVTPEDIMALSNEIKRQVSSSDIEIVPVCSVEVETRRGKSVKSGRNRVLAISFNGLWMTIAKNRPAQLFGKITNVAKGREKEIEDYKEFCQAFPCSSMTKFEIDILRTIITNYIKEIYSAKECMPANFDGDKKFFDAIFNFYADVTLQKPRSLSCYNVSVAYNDFVNYNIIDNKKLKELFEQLNVAFKNYNNCWFFDGEESIKLREARNELISFVESEIKELLKRIDNVINSYKIELQLYGEYCLKNNGFDSCGNKINSEKDLLVGNEQAYYEQVLYYVMDGYITRKERDVLNKLRYNLGISEYRAEAIETFARTKNPNAVK